MERSVEIDWENTSATEAFIVNFPRTCHQQEGQKLVVATARDAKIVFEWEEVTWKTAAPLPMKQDVLSG